MSEDQRVYLPLGHNANSGYGFAESGRSMKYSGIVIGKRRHSLFLITTQRCFQADFRQQLAGHSAVIDFYRYSLFAQQCLKIIKAASRYREITLLNPGTGYVTRDAMS